MPPASTISTLRQPEPPQLRMIWRGFDKLSARAYPRGKPDRRETSMKLYGVWNMGNPRRVSVFLAEKGIEVPWEFIDLKSPAFLKINPFGRMPVLELDDGSYLPETVAICRYFEALHPDPPLFGIGG